jgi:hypothetical protein
MKRRNLSLIISGLLGVIAILSGIYLMAASVTNYIAESQKTDWIVTEARITDVSSRVKMLMYGREAQSKTKTASPATIPKSGERNRKIHSCMLYLISI